MSASASVSQAAIIELAGVAPGARRPRLAVYALDRTSDLLAVFPVDKDGRFALSQEILQRAHQIVIGPRTDDWDDLKNCGPLFYPAALFERMLAERGIIQIARRTWLAWSLVRPHAHGVAAAEHERFSEVRFQILIY